MLTHYFSIYCSLQCSLNILLLEANQSDCREPQRQQCTNLLLNRTSGCRPCKVYSDTILLKVFYPIQSLLYSTDYIVCNLIIERRINNLNNINSKHYLIIIIPKSVISKSPKHSSLYAPLKPTIPSSSAKQTMVNTDKQGDHNGHEDMQETEEVLLEAPLSRMGRRREDSSRSLHIGLSFRLVEMSCQIISTCVFLHNLFLLS